jgi:two-component system, sensor histidine kinase and response regulator
MSQSPFGTPQTLANPQPSRPWRVLVADDDRANQLVARRMLEKLGCQVAVVANGRAALVAVAHDPYDLVLMDCQMPEMDGYAATAAIRAQEARTGGHLPIIALTASAERACCLAAGMDAYLRKPLRPDALAAMLQQWGLRPLERAG